MNCQECITANPIPNCFQNGYGGMPEIEIGYLTSEYYDYDVIVCLKHLGTGKEIKTEVTTDSAGTIFLPTDDLSLMDGPYELTILDGQTFEQLKIYSDTGANGSTVNGCCIELTTFPYTHDTDFPLTFTTCEGSSSGDTASCCTTVYEDGTLVLTSASYLNFTGSGVSVTDNGDGTVTITVAGGGGSGDVVGPASATDNAVALYDGTTGKLIKNSSVTEANIIANNAKVSNATHTGEVTGSGALTVDPTAISNKVEVTAVAGDKVLIEDATDGTLKKADASDFIQSGDVTSSANIADDTIVRGDGGAKGIQDSGVTLDDSDGISGVTTLDMSHTSLEDDDHALEIDINTGGFADVKAVDIVYTTGALVAGEDDGIVLINIDESLATGGEVFALEVLTTTVGSEQVIALKTGVGIDPVSHDSGTFANMDSLLVLAVDQLAALSSGGAGNVSVFVADNDTMTIGNAVKWDEFEFIVDTGASGSGVAPTWEYSTGVGTWSAFVPTDGTNGFKNTGAVLWDSNDLSGWATGTGGEFLIRITRTRNSLATTPILDLVQISSVTVYSWDKDGVITGNTLEATGDTSVGDSAAIGYTGVEGIIITGQGSTYDVNIKNDADGRVLSVPTGTTNIDVAGNIVVGGTVDGRDIAADGATLDDLPVSNLANGTDGELITWDALGAPTTVAVGTSGQVLTSNGPGAAPSFGDLPAGGPLWQPVGNCTSSTIADGNNYYIGSTYNFAATLNHADCHWEAPVNCQVNEVSVWLQCSNPGAAGPETTDIVFDINNGSNDQTVISGFDWGVVGLQSAIVTGLTGDINANDTVALRIDSATYTTNPVSGRGGYIANCGSQ